ncbi:MAG: HDOD domain-containing protein [Candidatus Eisenbacteria bacterium]
MFGNLWKRLFGASERTPAAPSAPPATEATALAAVVAETAADTPAPAAVAPEVPPEQDAASVEAALRRSLHWRAKVLMDGVTRDTQQSDAPALVEELVKAGDAVIRQPPDAAARALSVSRNPNSSLAQIVVLFEHDPMLVQSLLRQANSIYYRRDGQPCNSVHAAVQRVGMKGVQGILMESMVQHMLCRPGGAYDALVQKVWSHMQRTAPIARAIAPAFGVDGETAYSLALLHDVGKLLVFDHVSGIRHKRRREVKLPDLFFRQLLWHMHEPLGGLAALRWGMGVDAARAISEHHRRPAPQTVDLLSECLHVSEAIELAHTNFTKLDWDAIWRNGEITSDVAAVQDRLRRMED